MYYNVKKGRGAKFISNADDTPTHVRIKGNFAEILENDSVFKGWYV